jgi:hypothetical protein
MKVRHVDKVDEKNSRQLKKSAFDKTKKENQSFPLYTTRRWNLDFVTYEFIYSLWVGMVRHTHP